MYSTERYYGRTLRLDCVSRQHIESRILQSFLFHHVAVPRISDL